MGGLCRTVARGAVGTLSTTILIRIVYYSSLNSNGISILITATSLGLANTIRI